MHEGEKTNNRRTGPVIIPASSCTTTSFLTPEDRILLKEKCNPAILFPVDDTMKRTRVDKRPVRAALLYQDGTT